jgi:hypothetical protein|tara:strand:+ start:1273 stop:1500 length:228 start_codon:yes stop_codon:yes gene_type:complete
MKHIIRPTTLPGSPLEMMKQLGLDVTALTGAPTLSQGVDEDGPYFEADFPGIDLTGTQKTALTKVGREIMAQAPR